MIDERYVNIDQETAEAMMRDCVTAHLTVEAGGIIRRRFVSDFPKVADGLANLRRAAFAAGMAAFPSPEYDAAQVRASEAWAELWDAINEALAEVAQR